MQAALDNIFELLYIEFYQPVLESFNNSILITNFINFVNKILNAIFKIFNNDNTIEIVNNDMATILTILLFVICVIFVIELFLLSIQFIKETFTEITPKEKRFKTGGHKKKKAR